MEKEYLYCEMCQMIFPLPSMLAAHQSAKHGKKTNQKISQLLKNWQDEITMYSSDSDCEYTIVATVRKVPKIKQPQSYSDEDKQSDESMEFKFEIRTFEEDSENEEKNEPISNRLRWSDTNGSSKTELPETFRSCEFSKPKLDSKTEIKDNKISKQKSKANEESVSELAKNVTKSPEFTEKINKTWRTINKCTICAKQYKNLKSFENHMKKQHDVSVPKIEKAKRNITINENGQIETADKSIYKCEPCQKFFFDFKRYTLHLKKHTTNSDDVSKKKVKRKTHLCSFCGKHYPDSHALKMHIPKHTGELPFNCEICAKGFRLKQTLQDHMFRHSGDGTGIKPYICPAEGCGKAFAHASGKRQHYESVHTDNKRFQCEHCQRCFKKKEHLTCHIRSHTGERPYPCKYCNMSFKLAGTRRIHHRTHTGEQPFVCKICNKGFIKSSGLRVHMKNKKNCAPQPPAESITITAAEQATEVE